MTRHILVFYGSYRRDRQGIKLAHWLVDAIIARGDSAELIDAKAVDLPMLDRMYQGISEGRGAARDGGTRGQDPRRRRLRLCHRRI